ncbi:MAG: YkgJ family cysteine cluster protein [Oscillatoriales cyanobacterium RM2_1_1]|nr:YkgJ family cysteine cluster protein [Oscillatoriales cyanobacterium SM2_3_0]NJO45098.1 YkgJ family cysteine cluster protein [Oscillatoriales cyanobacterium RM2_1_1]
MDLGIASQVMESYTQIDQTIAAFQSATHLDCPPGCGWCCENPEVETTILEILPLVIELFRQETVEFWLQRAADSQYQGQCVFYQPDPSIPGNGRCQVYPWRPTICRLFGFATVTQKSGQVQLAACVKHKAALPAILAQAQGAIAQNQVQAPNFAEVTQQITNLDPTLGQERMPINTALRVAIERFGLYLQMTVQPQDLPTQELSPPT